MNRCRPPDPSIKLIHSLLFFHSVFAPPDHGSTSNYLHGLNYCVKHELYVLKLSPNNMLKQLIVCDINKASLGLPTKLLRECAKEMFNMPLVLGAFTENGKTLISSVFIKVILSL